MKDTKEKHGKGKDVHALTEAENADKWDDLLLMSERLSLSA